MDLQAYKETDSAVKYYKPSELIGIFNNALSRQNESAQVVFLRGIYLQRNNQGNWTYCYDTLRDEDSQEELTLQLTPQLRQNLSNGNLVMVGGLLGRNINPKGYIQLMLKVSRISVVQEQAIDEDEIKRMELRQKKASSGFKNVDAILEQKLFTEARPKIALILAQTSITMSDFNSGINAAKSAIDFEEFRVNFSSTDSLTAILQDIDGKGFDVIALVRGGGEGLEKLDIPEVIETVVGMKTATIAALGHVEEKLFIKQVVDKAAPTPNGLGQYFSEMVEKVSESKTKSRAVLTEQIKKQFQEQIEAGQKQNKELQEKLKVLTDNQKTAAEAQEKVNKKNEEQVAAAQKQNKELQEQLKSIQKTHEEQIAKLTEAHKEQNAIQQKQQEMLNTNLTKLQESNTRLQKNLDRTIDERTDALKQLNLEKEKNGELERKLASKGGDVLWKVAAVIAFLVMLLALVL